MKKNATTALAALIALCLPLTATADEAPLAVPYEAVEVYEGETAYDTEELQAYTDASGAVIVKSVVMPLPLAEEPGAAPFAGAQWVPGYWYDRPLSKKWEWVPGYWTNPAPPVVVTTGPKVVVRPPVRVRWARPYHRRWR